MVGTDRRQVCGALLSMGLAAMAGCATPTPRMPATANGTGSARRLSGRLGVQVADDAQRSFSAAFDLVGNATAGEMVLTSPIGTRLAQARWTSMDARLETSDGTRLFPSLDALASEVFREDIPLVALLDWLDGQPWAGSASTPLNEPALGFTQLGWIVHLDRQTDGLIVAVRPTAPTVTVRARIDRP